ncbi:hypothetical protein BMG523Draft_04425 [Frankia sp. BMG5.23]|nr:hypothetical protein BMG523Draft_04425 [Frankia sp. BMG5.23]
MFNRFDEDRIPRPYFLVVLLFVIVPCVVAGIWLGMATR